MELQDIIRQFKTRGEIDTIKPLGNGLINDTLKVTTTGDTPDYVLQRINHHIFPDVDMLQHNIEVVTAHLRKKLEEAHESDIDRKVLQFVATENGKTYYQDGDGNYWRMSVFIPRSVTKETVNAENAYATGKAFGQFQSMLVDLPETLGETIPNFHNMEFRLVQLSDAVDADPKGRVREVEDLLDEIEKRSWDMCKGERLFREGKLPKRTCHCDTKVNNILFDEDGKILCVIDLDTIMPNFVFSDYGDFLRTAANTAAEDEKDVSKIAFNTEVFEVFTKGYLQSAASFLTPIEIENLPYAVALFPYMQCVRFLTDYINGDTYYKIGYPEHNLVRTQAQFALLQRVEEKADYMKQFIASLEC